MKPPPLTLLLAAAATTATARAEPPARPPGADDAPPRVQLHEHLVEGWRSSPPQLDLADAAAVFRLVFSQLPAEVDVHPGENYYYWRLPVAGRDLHGSIGLPAGRRDRGLVSFGCTEWDEAPADHPTAPAARIAHARYLGPDDGIEVARLAPFRYLVRCAGRQVTFRLTPIPQHPPRWFGLLEGERFVERTRDDSGLGFVLLFNAAGNYFLWVLDEEEPAAEQFTELGGGVVAGNRSGFVYWLDPEARPRKVLAAVRRASVARNDHYDGPFDQLSDNHVETGEVEIRSLIELALPAVRGRIDRFGYYTDTARPARVALATYGTYGTLAEAAALVAAAVADADPRRAISRGGAVRAGPCP